jgi:hypothetical protein
VTVLRYKPLISQEYLLFVKGKGKGKGEGKGKDKVTPLQARCVPEGG